MIDDDSLEGVPTPCYVIDEAALARNLELLDGVQRETGARILLALKGFATHAVFPLLRERLHGVAASSLHEARLGREEFGREVHVHAPAFRDEEFPSLLSLADHLVFNSLTQWERYRPTVEAAARKVSCGLRVNPEHSEVDVAIYDPCAPGSRLGIPRDALEGADISGIEGLHFHTLCEKGADALERTVDVFEERFGSRLGGLEWVNLGGGHHITRDGYEIDRLCAVVRRLQDRYGVRVYLEPGEAVALHAGVLVARVLDVIHRGIDIAILDTSATAHMPDVLEMPYRPQIAGATAAGELPHSYRLGGLTCLAGDVIGDYSFEEPLQPGSRLVFLDMAHYTMVKNTTFNGIPLPSIAIRDARTRKVRVVRRFSYEDYRDRLS